MNRSLLSLAAAAVVAGGIALAAPAGAQTAPAPPSQACDGANTVASTLGGVQDTIQQTAGQQAPAGIAQTIQTGATTAGCPVTAASAPDDSSSSGDTSGSPAATTGGTTSYNSPSTLGSTAADDSAPTSLPRTGGTDLLLPSGLIALVAVAARRLRLRSLT